LERAGYTGVSIGAEWNPLAVLTPLRIQWLGQNLPGVPLSAPIHRLDRKNLYAAGRIAACRIDESLWPIQIKSKNP
jgi:hypothetical protein